MLLSSWVWRWWSQVTWTTLRRQEKLGVRTNSCLSGCLGCHLGCQLLFLITLQSSGFFALLYRHGPIPRSSWYSQSRFNCVAQVWRWWIVLLLMIKMTMILTNSQLDVPHLLHPTTSSPRSTVEHPSTGSLASPSTSSSPSTLPSPSPSPS